jgi:DNA polymerase-3 subunit delta
MILKRRPDIDRFLKGPDRAIRVALIYGADLGVVRERARALASAITPKPDDPFDAALLNEGDIEAEPGRLEGELMAYSMMGGRRLVRLRLGGDRVGPDRLAAEALAEHAAGKFNPDAFFIIEAGALGRDSQTRKVAEKTDGCAVIPCYEDEIGDLKIFTREALAEDKLALTTEAMDLFVSRLPHERGVARQEMERLALFLGPGSGRVASAKDLDDFLGVEPEVSLAEAANDAFGGRLAAAHAGLRRAAQEGEVGVVAVRAMGLHLGKLRRALALQRSGASPQEAAKASGVFWKAEREFMRQARVWTAPELDRLQADILAADLACKQTGSPDRLLAERLALTVAGRARRLGL